MAAAAYRFSLGPWNLGQGADPFGPPVRPQVSFDEVLDIAVGLGFEGIQLHDDDAVAAAIAERDYEAVERLVLEHLLGG